MTMNRGRIVEAIVSQYRGALEDSRVAYVQEHLDSLQKVLGEVPESELIDILDDKPLDIAILKKVAQQNGRGPSAITKLRSSVGSTTHPNPYLIEDREEWLQYLDTLTEGDALEAYEKWNPDGEGYRPDNSPWGTGQMTFDLLEKYLVHQDRIEADSSE